MPVDAQGEGRLDCPIWIELERRTNAGKVAEKVQRMSGYFLRLLVEEDRCEIRPVLVVHFDPRCDRWAERTPGTGAEGLRDRVCEVLFSEGRDNHFLELDRRLLKMDDSLDLGRMFVFCDWWSLYTTNYSAPLFPISSLHGGEGDGGPVGVASFREMVKEWRYTFDTVLFRLSRDEEDRA